MQNPLPLNLPSVAAAEQNNFCCQQLKLSNLYLMTNPRKILVLDANILIRAVLGVRVRELILTHSDRVHFFTPLTCIEEARRHLPDILRSRGVDPATAMEVLDGLLNYVQPLELEWLGDYADVAQQRLQRRDPNDWPVLAAALTLACPIWTQDADFFGVGVATWTTEHVDSYLSS
jgi:predicted nucleic acid-binding protein